MRILSKKYYGIYRGEVVNNQDANSNRANHATLDPRLAKVFTGRVLNAEVVDHNEAVQFVGRAGKVDNPSRSAARIRGRIEQHGDQ